MSEERTNKESKPLEIKELKELEIKYNVVIKELRSLRFDVANIKKQLESEQLKQTKLPFEDERTKKRKTIILILGITNDTCARPRREALADAWLKDSNNINLEEIARIVLDDPEVQKSKKRGEFKRIDKHSIQASVIKEINKLRKANI